MNKRISPELQSDIEFNPAVLDVPLLVFIEITLNHSGPDRKNAFKLALANIPEIIECYMVTGRFDYLVKVRVNDMFAYRDFFDKLLLTVRCIQKTHSRVVLEEVKAISSVEFPSENSNLIA
ncbi:Lrp/AsnC ligand binding domain-containing protein [Collimonas silvisoli]|uniref:Lrp/AsnC ligand binding domain-containing protein n=1 Tax=Collimonas silvisoli TaxID=2825884 RepID=UPI001B8CD2CB|nr:Lrp/AsnC ligand binding domain-containing protein [Collimonas silvisoli]